MTHLVNQYATMNQVAGYVSGVTYASQVEESYDVVNIGPASAQGIEIVARHLRELQFNYENEMGQRPWYWDTDFFHTIEDAPRTPGFQYPYRSESFRIGSHIWKRREVNAAIAKRPLYAMGSEEAITHLDTVIEHWIIQTNGYWTEFRKEGALEGEKCIWRFEYAWCCRGDEPPMPGPAKVTGQFAPISEFQEIQPEDYIAWENKIIGDEQYRLLQEQGQRLMLSVTREVPMYEERPRPTMNSNMYQIIVPKVEHPKVSKESFKSPLYCIAEITPERRAELLLKSWLTDNEYASLVSDGELAIPSQHEKDVVYIVKRSPHERVRVKKAGKEVQQLCVVPSTSEVPSADNLLAKILFLKADEKKFVEMAGKYGPDTPRTHTANANPYIEQQYYNAVNTEVSQFQVQGNGTQWAQIQMSGTAAATTPTTNQYIIQAPPQQFIQDYHNQWLEMQQPATDETVICRQVDAHTETTTTYHRGEVVWVRTTRRAM